MMILSVFTLGIVFLWFILWAIVTPIVGIPIDLFLCWLHGLSAERTFKDNLVSWYFAGAQLEAITIFILLIIGVALYV